MFLSADSPLTTAISQTGDETLTALLTCTVSSKPESTIKWFRLGSPDIEITEGIIKGNKSLEYRIASVSRDDAGDYMCTADNGYGGAVNSNTSLVVRCKFESVFFVLF